MNSVTANYYQDNTDYTSILESLGSNKSINQNLNIKNFNINDTSLNVVLYVKSTSQEILDLINAHKDVLELKWDQLHISTTLDKINKENEGISFSMSGEFDQNWQPIKRAYGIQVKRQTVDKEDERKDKHDAL